MSQDNFGFFLHSTKILEQITLKWKLLEKLKLRFTQIKNIPSVKLKSNTKSS